MAGQIGIHQASQLVDPSLPDSSSPSADSSQSSLLSPTWVPTRERHLSPIGPPYCQLADPACAPSSADRILEPAAAPIGSPPSSPGPPTAIAMDKSCKLSARKMGVMAAIAMPISDFNVPATTDKSGKPSVPAKGAITVPMFKPDPPEDPAEQEARQEHQKFINTALDMARLALKTNETPVGCVLVCDGKIIARGMNATNITRNGTRHAEFMALGALLSVPNPASIGAPNTANPSMRPAVVSSNFPDSPCPVFDDTDEVKSGPMYPYGVKLMPAGTRVPRSIVHDCILYVTVEPCVMCASLLRQLGIKKVYFGAVNDKFGGVGGVLRMHINSPPAPVPPFPVPYAVAVDTIPPSLRPPPGHMVPPALAKPDPRIGDGGDVEPGYEVEGGWGRDEAVALLRRFYVQENNRAPVPRKKDGRAARLATQIVSNTGDPQSIPPELAVHVQAADQSQEDQIPETSDSDDQVAELASATADRSDCESATVSDSAASSDVD